MNVNELKQLSWNDINTMNKDELMKNTRKLVNVINKRIDVVLGPTQGPIPTDEELLNAKIPIISESGESSGTSLGNYILEHNGKVRNLRDLNTNQLKKLFRETQHTLNAKTGSYRGFEKVLKKQSERLNISKKNLKNYWNSYNKFKEVSGDLLYRLGSNQVQKLLAEYSEGKYEDDIGSDIINDMREYVKDREDRQNALLDEEIDSEIPIDFDFLFK